MVYGIDLGTSYSVIAGCDEHGNISIINNGEDHGSTATPSVVFFNKETGKPIAGTVAKGRMEQPMFGEQVLYFFKLQMGNDYCPDKIKFQNKNRSVSPVEASACVLHYLKHIALLNHRPEPLFKAVVTVPRSFSFEQKACTRVAAELAGIEVLGVLHEPTAAAISYDIKEGETVLVFDLGGGTLDVSIVKNDSGNYRVLGGASDSDVVGANSHIGGKDWDEKIIEHALLKLKGKGLELNRNDRYIDARLRNIAERCKIELTKDDSAYFSYGDYSEEITRAIFQRITQSLLNDCIRVVEKAIEDAQKELGTESLEINRFVLAGGSSNMRMIKPELIRRYGKKYAKGRTQDEWLKLDNPERAIAEGAAKYAHLIDGGQAEKIIDKSPYSYGTIALKDGILTVKNLILSSSPMVIEKGEIVSFAAKKTDSISVDVVESKCELADFPYLENEHKKIYDETYYFDKEVQIGTKVDFSVSRNRDGLISIVVACKGHHEQTFPIDIYKSRISNEVKNQITQSIRLMDQH